MNDSGKAAALAFPKTDRQSKSSEHWSSLVSRSGSCESAEGLATLVRVTTRDGRKTFVCCRDTFHSYAREEPLEIGVPSSSGLCLDSDVDPAQRKNEH